MLDDYYLRVGKASDLRSSGDRALFRLCEILPGFLSWGTLILVVIFSWKRPVLVAFFILVFIVLWFFRTLYLFFHLRAGYQKMRENEKIDWLKKLNNLHLTSYTLHLKNWRDIYHLILLPTYKEPLEIVRDTFLALEKSDFPKEKMIVVLSCEERAGEQATRMAGEIKKEFSNKFFKLLVTSHPANMPGEIAGHGSNDAWAAKEAKEVIVDPLKIPYENIIVSSFDTDTIVFPKYFSCLTYYYLTVEKPTRTSFQPIPLYINNIWQAPVLSRVLSFSSTFWHTMNQQRPEKLITFSSHAMSFKALVDVGFKQKNVVSDDSRIFWQCFLKYDGDYRVQPIFYPVSMDANCAKSFWRTMINIYRQQRRWAYGVGDIAYFLFGFLKHNHQYDSRPKKKISFWKKITLGFELIEGHWSWAVASFLIFLLGWLPLILGGPEFSQTVISYSLPKITSKILTVAMIGLIGSCYLSLLSLPPRPPDYGRHKYLIFALGWLLLPIMMMVFTSLPALDAQTRWMLGKYMGFWPTEKVRKTI